MKQKIIAFLVAFTITGAMADMPPAAELEKIDIAGMANFTRFDGPPGFAGSPVAFGGTTQPSAMPWLKSEGFAAVINLRFATEEGVDIDASRAAADAAGLDYIHMPFNPDNLDQTIVAYFLATAGNQANQPVYIHCHSATRVAALWMIGRVLEDGRDIDAAAKEVELIAAKPAEAAAIAIQYIESLEN